MTKKVLITGVSGLVGSSAYLRLAEQPEKYEVYGLGRRRAFSERVPAGRRIDLPDERFFLCDITEMDPVRRAVEGMETVVHMAAYPGGESWPDVLAGNLIGAYNVFEACRRAEVERIVAASSMQVSEGHGKQGPYKTVAQGCAADIPPDFTPLTAEVPAEPRNIYACSKVWTESLARTYADIHGISCIALRIGWVTAEDRPRQPGTAASVWCSQRDIAQLIQRCVDAPADLRFDVLYGTSDNAQRWVDIERARRRVGYVPQDRAEDHLTSPAASGPLRS